MKAYELYDEELERHIGILFHYEKKNDFVIELDDKLDEWTAPLLFSNSVKNGIFTIPRKESAMWVDERVIPKERQNISSILKKHNMRSYDEMKLLELSHARSSQDSIIIRSIDIMPDYVIERASRHIIECFISSDNDIICFFNDDSVRKINLSMLTDLKGMDKVINNRILFESVKVSPGGFGITFDDAIDIPCDELYRSGILIPLKPDDFRAFIINNILDTTGACKEMNCSRQNISYLVSQGLLCPVKQYANSCLYTNGEIQKNEW